MVKYVLLICRANREEVILLEEAETEGKASMSASLVLYCSV